MRKKVLPIILPLLLAGQLLLLSGCAGRELTDVALIRVLGVDGPGPVVLTALEGGAEGRCYETEGADVLEAQAGLCQVGEKRLEVTHVAQLVLGADADVTATLWQEVIHRDSGYGATVWLADGPAGELLKKAEDPAGRLKSLEENGGAAPPTLLAALSDLSRTGRTVLPVVGEKEGELEVLELREIEGVWPVEG